jgi:hypothetical protein
VADDGVAPHERVAAEPTGEALGVVPVQPARLGEQPECLIDLPVRADAEDSAGLIGQEREDDVVAAPVSLDPQ